jgi:protein-S-isoprenylcysteine O-methyltransferase Ste14
MKTRVYPPMIFLGAVLLSVVLNRAIPVARFLEFPVRYLGVPVILLGGLFAVLPARAFDRAGTTVRPFQESSTLITGGLNRTSRNPMYLGMVLILLGFDIVLGSVAPFLILPIFMILLTRKFIRHEEAMLEARFGDEYREYKRRVRRWV